jgi:two-component system LytT family response regulator
MIRALIVDDEFHAREELGAILEETGEFTVAGKCANALDAMKFIRKERPDVVFLDIQMPVIDGFEFLGMMEEELLPHVVFVTAYDTYAIKAFDENALDYLLKPVEKERLSKTIVRLKKSIDDGRRPAVRSIPEIKRVPCIVCNRIKLVNVSDIEYVRSGQSGIHVVCPLGEFYTELTLKVFESRTDLIRCHKQYLVNLNQVDEIIFREGSQAEIKMKTSRRIPVSRRYLKILKEQMAF